VKRSLHIAVVTPHYGVEEAWLERCRESVRSQTVPCTHFLVNDGDPDVELEGDDRTEVVRIPGPHRDVGNAGRAVGSVCAIAQQYEAIAYLDADNWYEPEHLESLVELHLESQALVCTSTRNLYGLDGTFLEVCPETDGVLFVDTSCMLLTRPAFGIVASWYLMPEGTRMVSDRVVLRTIKERKMSMAHTGRPTLNYTTRYAAHYEHVGKPSPPGAVKLEWVPEESRWETRKAGG
jgi:glycosyl transferase family 2